MSNAISCLEEALLLAKSRLLDNNGQPYSSLVMGKGLNIENLLTFKSMLTDLMEVDPRGGYFSQSDLVAKLMEISNRTDEKEFSDKLETIAAARQVTRSSVLERVAYCIRVMLNHCRVMRRAVLAGKEKAGALKDVLDCITPLTEDPWDAQPDEDEQYDARQRPFRQLEMEEAQSVPVDVHWEADKRKAQQRMSDDTIVDAAWYEQNQATGSIVAYFVDGQSWSTGIPNSCLIGRRFYKNGEELKKQDGRIEKKRGRPTPRHTR